ncbi:hypothetical protein [Nonomuraea rubra]|uniref:hypothetical protein n=1 Tax=Nonomuraea rubra TaxID=46180 RepID=UPI0033D51E00
MRFTPRRVAGAAVIACGLTVLAAPASYAVVDPMMVTECLTGSVGEVTHLVDPTAPGVPAEVPGVNCLAP